MNNLRILISGGGTGGHIFPAIAIADEIKKRFPEAEFLFIGATGKMEMVKVPQAGYKIEGLKITGFDRGNLLKNLALPFKIVSSAAKARRIIRKFKPDFAIGTGGFASAPALSIAAFLGVPIFVQEQNSLPGKTNVFLSKRAKAVFTAYPEMEKFFGGTKTFFLGNPVRKTVISDLIDPETARTRLGLSPEKLTILSVGGSQGSRTLNDGWKQNITNIAEKNYQLIWQTGKQQYRSLAADSSITAAQSVSVQEFISDMALAYSAADVIVSRAGAIAISELAIVGKAVLLVPFPHAAEDHQTKNALALVEKSAAKMVRDSQMDDQFWPTLMEICGNEGLRKEMSARLKFFAKPRAAEDIVDEIFRILNLNTAEKVEPTF